VRARQTTPRGVTALIGASVLIHGAALTADHMDWLSGRFAHATLHSAVEMAGALIALATAWMLVQLERRRAGPTWGVRLSAGLAAMGIFDAGHAMAQDLAVFAWMKALATLSGALIFASVWLPATPSVRKPGRWPLCAAALASAAGIYLFLEAGTLPPLVEAGELTPLTHALNLVSGGLLLCAALRLGLQYRARPAGDDLVFALISALFGASALALAASAPWDAAWWSWHALRLLAYGVALLYMASAYGNLQDSIASDLRERAERATRLTERLLESAPVKIFVSDCRAGRMLYASAAGRVMLDLPAHQIQTHGRRKLEEMIHHEDRARLQRLAACEPGAPDVEDCELRIRAGDDAWHWLYHRRAVLDREPGGAPRQIVEIATDITELKRAENALARLNVELARSNRDLEVYASVASHDLQTPIRNVATSVGFLQRDLNGVELPERAKRHLNALANTSAYMQKLVDGLLTFARVGTRGARLDTPVDTALLFKQIAEALEQPLTQARAQLSIGWLANVCGDKQQLRQLFQNLIENALRYCATERAPVIHIDSEVKLDKVLISIADNGIGIPEEFRETVFEMFKRLHLQEDYPGTGIGLAFCRRVAERHGGRIWVTGRSDGAPGSVFWIELPQRPPEGDKPW
jgi:signal transduction histidine kinase